jgi:hypothetical protein
MSVTSSAYSRSPSLGSPSSSGARHFGASTWTGSSVAGLRAFEERWGAIARSAGWSLMQLYGLDPKAPRARVGRMGAAFLASMPGRRVIAVDDKAITMVTRTSARLRIYRAEQDAGAVLAWELCTP